MGQLPADKICQVIFLDNRIIAKNIEQCLLLCVWTRVGILLWLHPWCSCGEDAQESSAHFWLLMQSSWQCLLAMNCLLPFHFSDYFYYDSLWVSFYGLWKHINTFPLKMKECDSLIDFENMHSDFHVILWIFQAFKPCQHCMYSSLLLWYALKITKDNMSFCRENDLFLLGHDTLLFCRIRYIFMLSVHRNRVHWSLCHWGGCSFGSNIMLGLCYK